MRYDMPTQGCDRPIRLCVIDIGKDRVYAVETVEERLKIP